MNTNEPIRANVSFHPKTVENLQELNEILPDVTKTDIINRSISVYLFIQRQINAGMTFYTTDQRGVSQQIHFS